MAGTALQRMGLGGLARATEMSLDWRNWGKSGKRPGLDKAGPSKDVLDKLIEVEIIPRLMLINRDGSEPVRADLAGSRENSPRNFTPAEVDAFARRTVSNDPEALVQEVYALLRDGASHDDVLLKLLAPAARRLGVMWDEDLCDFAEVTIGLMKMHRILERLNADAPCGMDVGAGAPRILLAPAPGEQHLFGVVMVGEFFGRSGWRVSCETSSETEYLLSVVTEEHYDVVGLSASCEFDEKALSTLIREIKAASLNRHIVVMVGGKLFNEDVTLARRVGADAAATDGVRAVVTAEQMVHSLKLSARTIPQ